MAVVKHLIADEFGTHVGKYSERLCVTRQKEKLAQAPLLHLESVLVTSRGVSVSADAFEACCERGIPVFFIDSLGKPFASVYSAGLTGTTLTRREQLLAYYDRRSVHVALTVAAGKIENQAATLKYMAKSRKESDPAAHEELQLCALEVRDSLAILNELADAERVDDIRQTLMNAEAQAAIRYWAAIRAIIPAEYEWHTREGRGATDPINSLLNYGYGILYGQIERAIVLAGLDPYAGFIHADRPGKPSLVLDLIEEFRQIAVDRVVFGLANRRYTIRQDKRGRLEQDTRRDYAEKILDRLETQVPYEGKRHVLRAVIQSQARHLATFLRGDRDAYEPFRAQW
ncbi:MAG: CRISPR-associated endonuclease Cas1 [Chloroflexi bacterium]|nr:CRISPR-associated endonuclease Cas1 [Chloroflexota bacterium]